MRSQNVRPGLDARRFSTNQARGRHENLHQIELWLRPGTSENHEMPRSFPCLLLPSNPPARHAARVRRVRLAAILLVALINLPVQANAPYDFCVTRVMQAGSDVLRTRLLFEDKDPGVELAGHLLIRHYRQLLVTAVRIEDYRPEVCGTAETQFLALRAGLGALQQAEPARRLADLGRAASQTANLVSETYMDVARQLTGVLGLMLEATNEALCSMIRC